MMREALILRFDAPLMSFGAVRVDNLGPTMEFPGRSMIAGLLGNALGYDRREAARLDRLQARLKYAARCDRPGVALDDFQTVDITLPFMREPGWTTRGAPEARGGGKETLENLHIRRRTNLADAVYTVAVALDPADESPDLGALEAALREPERPLFIGRKPCLPAAPLLVGRRQAGSLLEALRSAPRAAGGRSRPGPLRAWFEEGETVERPLRAIPVTDERDWANDIVVGRRIVLETTIDPAEVGNAG
jgi:CRISPR system Cascade subunit CasD